MQATLITDHQAFRAMMERISAGDPQAPGIPPAGGVPQAFCQTWPQTQQDLRFLAAIAPTMAGAGWFLEMVIPLVVSAGTEVYEALCQETLPSMPGAEAVPMRERE